MRVWRHLERRREARRIAEEYARSDALILTCLPRADDAAPLTVAVIRERTQLPLQRVYARLRSLEKAGLIQCFRTGTAAEDFPIAIYIRWQLTDEGCEAAERAAGY